MLLFPSFFTNVYKTMQTPSDSNRFPPSLSARSRTYSSPPVPINSPYSPLFSIRSNSSDKHAFSYQEEKPRTDSMSERLEAEMKEQAALRASNSIDEKSDDYFLNDESSHSVSLQENFDECESDDECLWDIELENASEQSYPLSLIISSMSESHDYRVYHHTLPILTELLTLHHLSLQQILQSHLNVEEDVTSTLTP